jgi:GNAT superfamily N-acetyltransferase
VAALTRPHAEVRAPQPGEGARIARLWRELWDAHEAWGGYPGAHDEATYAQVAARIDADATLRRGRPQLGRHLHLVGTAGGVVAGQVEGWMDRFGSAPQTPTSCEVRSLIVTEQTRASGLGRALLQGLADVSRELAGGPVALAAEVLEPNPAHAFYAKVGYRPVAWSVRLKTDAATWPRLARFAGPRDALAITLLDAALLARRRTLADPRFDPPRAVDASTLDAVATYLTRAPGELPAEVVVTDDQGYVRASGTLLVMHLDPPFVSAMRAALCRISVDPAVTPAPFVTPLIELAAHVARRNGARTLEVTDLGPPGSALHEAATSCNAIPWSRIVVRQVP